MLSSEIEQVIKEKAIKYDIPKSLIKAIIFVESSGNTYAMRYEKNYRWLYKVEEFAKKNYVPKLTEEIQQKISWGLMQIMGAVARERGFKGKYMAELCMPEIGLEFSCKHLKKYYDRYQSWEKAIASYNAGSPRKAEDGKYENQYYVDKVLKYWKER